jgi:phage-related holin
MIKSLEESIVTQAIKDLSNKKDFERESAILFFVENDHLHYCKQAGIDGVELRKSVFELLSEDGARRSAMIKDLIKDIPRY